MTARAWSGLIGVVLVGALASPGRAQPAPDAEPIMPAELSTQLIDNPYVEPAGKFGLDGAFDLVHSGFTDPATGMTASFTTEGFELGGGYGFTDHLTAGLTYAFPLAGDNTDETRFKGPLALYGEYSIVHGDRLVLAASADVTADLCGTYNAMGHCAVATTIHAGAGVRYKLTPNVALYSGAPIGPGPVGQQLSISTQSGALSSLGIPVGGELQVSPTVFTYLQTELLRFDLANGNGNVVDVIGTDALGVPLALGGLYAVSPGLHVGAQLDFADLKHIGDDYVIGIVLRSYR